MFIIVVASHAPVTHAENNNNKKKIGQSCVCVCVEIIGSYVAARRRIFNLNVIARVLYTVRAFERSKKKSSEFTSLYEI